MKNPILRTSTLFVACLLLFYGCGKDSSNTPTPAAGKDRDAFIHTWNVSDSAYKQTYEVTILTDPNSADGVLISGFAHTLPTDPYAGAVISGTKITLDPNQVIGDGLKINGSGTLSGSVITWKYTVSTGADLFTYKAVYTRK